jgi:hypothetical protein
MNPTLSGLNALAARAAVSAAGISTKLEQGLVALPGGMVPVIDCFRQPGLPATDPGWITSGVVKADLNIGFRRIPGVRTVYLVIDRAGAPITGSYVVEVEGDTATYDATSEAPADVDELIAGIVDEINGSAIAVHATASAIATVPGGPLDAIMLTGTGTPAAFLVDADTAFPSGAALAIYGEITSASARIYVRQIPSARTVFGLSASQPLDWIRGGWRVTRDLGALTEAGFLDYLLVSSVDAVWVELYDVVQPADAPGVVPVAAVTVARAQLEP